MRHLRDRAAHRRRIWPLDNLVQLAQTQTTDDFLLLRGKRDRAAIVLNFDLGRRSVSCFLLRHTISSHLFRLDAGLPASRTDAESRRILIRVLPPAYHGVGRPRMDPSFAAARRKSRALHCAGSSIPEP